MQKTNFARELFIDWKNILLKPGWALPRLKSESTSWSKALLSVLIAGLIAGFSNKIIERVVSGKIVIGAGLVPVLVVLVLVLAGTIIWLFAKLFGGKEKLSAWLRLFLLVYSPIVALIGIPYVTYAAQVYGTYILYLTIKHVMKVNWVRSIATLVSYVLFISLLYFGTTSFFSRTTNSLDTAKVYGRDAAVLNATPDKLSGALNVTPINLSEVPEWMMTDKVLIERADVAVLEKFGVLPYNGLLDEEVEAYNKAVTVIDEEKCDRFDFLKELCIAHIAKLKNNKSLCELAAPAQRYCYNFFENINFTHNEGFYGSPLS